jgi:MATE family multidrug resistance protein
VCQFGQAILLAAGQQPRIAARAGGFLATLEWAMVPMIACNVLRTFVSAMGRPVFATAITALAIAVNALGNYAFVFGHLGAPALGLNGSALSSDCTALATLAAYGIAIRADRHLHRYRLLGHWWRADWGRLRALIRLGAPIGFTVVAEAGLFGGAAFLMGLFSEAQLAAHTVALQIAAFAFQLPIGIGQAATIRVGYHFGAGDRAALGRAGWIALGIGIGCSLASAALMIGAPRLILSAYVDVTAPANAAMLRYAVSFLAVAAAFQLADGAQAIAAGALRGLQDTRMPMAIAVFGYWLPGFGTAIALGFLTPLQGVGVWIGLAIGLLVVAGLLMLRWNRRERLGLVSLSA